MSSGALIAALEAVGAPSGALVTVLAVPVYDPAIELAERWGADGADLIAAALEPTADLLELRDALAAGDRALVKRTLAGDLERSLEPVLRQHALRAAAAGYVTTLRAWGAPEAHAAVPLPPKLVQWIGRAIAAELKGLVAGGKQAVRQAVQAAVAKGGVITPAMVRSVRQAIALTPRQQAALDRFRRAQAKAGLKGQKLDAAVRAEAKRVLDDRARLIAEEQTARAMAMAQRVAWGALAKTGRINARWRKLWVTKRDQQVCPVCEDLDGETAPLDGLFDDEFYGPPEPHPRCRCQIILVAPGERHSAYFVDYVFPGNPWHVERRGRGRFLVVQSLSGKVVGEHGTLAEATAQIRALHASVPEGHAGGNDPGHPFWGNQYTGGAGGDLEDEEREEAEQNLVGAEVQDADGMSMARGEFMAQVEDALGPRGVVVASDALTIGRSVLGESGKVTLQVDPEAQSLLVSTQSARGAMDRLYHEVGGQLEVEHMGFDVEEEYQGMGHAREMMSLSMRSYMENGVAAVNVSAGHEVGGYAWARAGFEARNEQEFRLEVFKSGGWGKLSSERQDELMAGLDKHGTRSPAWLASQPEGRSILLGSGWAGRLDLRSEYGRKVAERFAYGGDE